MKSHLWLVLAVATAAPSAQAQAPKGFTDCNADKELPLSKGDQLKVTCDFAVVFSPEAYAKLKSQRDSIAKLDLLLEGNRKDRDALLSQQQQLVSELQHIKQLQDHYYEALKQKYDATDRAAVESASNTREALRLAQGARISSYVTAGILGGLGGGVGGWQIGNQSWLGTGAGIALGSLVGLGINWALLHFMGAQ